jgi:hypothetical protein
MLLERLLAISAVRGILHRILANTTIMGATRGCIRGGKVSVGVTGSVIVSNWQRDLVWTGASQRPSTLGVES